MGTLYIDQLMFYSELMGEELWNKKSSLPYIVNHNADVKQTRVSTEPEKRLKAGLT
jgi:hypothetical protein